MLLAWDSMKMQLYLFQQRHLNTIMYDDLSLKYFKPKSINNQLTKQLFTGMPDSVKANGKDLLSKNWRFYVTDQKRGYCTHRHKVITIPSWVFLRPQHNIQDQKIQVTPESILGYKCWYICHEMAHAYIGVEHNHDDVFMAKLREICPREWQIFELSYKPRNAARAGIGSIDYSLEELGFA